MSLGAHSTYHAKDLQPGDEIDSYAGPGADPGRHRGQVLGTEATETGVHLRVDCTVCQTEHFINEGPHRLIPAVRKP